ncbi:serine/threonine-protein kinase atr-like [Prorops nasuta]|uniref:serine/threonine-protein kinase atr-like n=1 Tax=Prorops nasuta TaxID=863751 RepID=UPI0034CE9AFF
METDSTTLTENDSTSAAHSDSTGNGAAVAESLWKFINSPVLAIFSDLKNASVEQMLRSFLDSILKGSANLRNVLVPPNGINKTEQSVQKQYTAFTTWLFGTMFYIVGEPLSNQVLSSSIKVQACMLRILSALNIVLYNEISREYTDILKELLEFDLRSVEDDTIQLSKFNVERYLIEGIDLTPFPVTMKSLNVPVVQISIIKIFIKSGISVCNHKNFWPVLLRIIKESNPEVKVYAVKLCSQIFNFSVINTTPEDDVLCHRDHNLDTLIMYVTEMVKSTVMWRSSGHLSKTMLQQFIDTLIIFVQTATISDKLYELSIEILHCLSIKTLTNNIEDHSKKSLEEAVCCQLRKYLITAPRSCTETEVSKFLGYFQSCPLFTIIFIHFVLNDIKQKIENGATYAVEICDAWKSLQEHLMTIVCNQDFEQSLHILKASSLLEINLKRYNFNIFLYQDELNKILDIFIKSCNTNKLKLQMILENLTQVMAHEESNRPLIQSILTSVFTRKTVERLGRKVIQTFEFVDVDIKVKCLNAICEYGSGKERMHLLSSVLFDNKMDKIVEPMIDCLLNTVLLLREPEILLEDIFERILKKILNCDNEKAEKTLAKVLGQVVCFLAGNADIVRETSNAAWTINCKHCENDENTNNQRNERYLSEHHDKIIKQFYKLFSSPCKEVRQQMSENLCCFSAHVKSFHDNKITQIWVKYIQDSQLEVRVNTAEVVGKILRDKIDLSQKNGELFQDDVPDDLRNFVNTIMETILDTLEKALDASNNDLHVTVLDTAKNFVCTPLYLTERKMINVLFITILHPMSSPVVVASASIAYQEVAKSLGISPKLLYFRYKKEFLKLMMQRVVCNYIDHSYNIATSIHWLAQCIGYDGSRQLLYKDGHHAICYLLFFITEQPKAYDLLHDMAKLLAMDEKQLFVDYFPNICSYAFLHVPVIVGTQCLKIVSKITQVNLTDLLTEYFTGIFGELMLNFYESPEKVISYLEIISEYDSHHHKANFNTKEGVALYLMPQLHGILVNLDMNLGIKSDEYTQKSALASLATLMWYMGQEFLTPLKYKILATLRTSLNFKRPGFGPLVCEAWNAFLHNISFDDLGQLLPTICVSMIPLLERYPNKANAMLEFLFVRNNEAMSGHISELFFIDDINASSTITNIVKAHVLQAKPADFGESLKVWMKRIMHETDEVRLRALKHLQKFLAEHRVELNEMILSNTDVHPLIVELLNILLLGCQDKDEALRLLYGECLGELGAIEPSLLPRRIISRDESNFISDMNEKFTVALLLENVRAFQMQKSTHSMDCFSLAIQEILGLFEISPQGKNSESWHNLPLSVQQIIIPFLTSHYKITTIEENNFPHPIYGSESGSSVESWTLNWLCSLHLAIKNETLNNMLRACKPAFKRDMKTMIFCLPHVVAYVIINGTKEAREKLKEEMLTVISVKEETTVDPELLRRRPLRHDLSTKVDNTRISDEARRTHCSQIVFTVLDHLQQWLRERRLLQDNAYVAIQTFCSQLDSLVIAQGCYQSREYHRGLMYLEQHMVSSNKGLSDLTEGGLLAKMYAQLDEPDGVSGILATQNQSPTLQQLVLAHEVSGQLQDAAMCYERLAQKKKLQPSYLQGMIQCYLGLDEPFTAMHITEGVLSNRPELEPLMNEHEPFWRLAHFTSLNDDSQKNIKRALLDDLKNGIKPDVLTVKKNLISLLAHASRPGAYQQSYSSIMKLHVLNEFDKAVSLMLQNVNNLPKIFNEWEKRGQLVRASRGVEFVLSMRRATLDLGVHLQQSTNQIENSVLKEEIGKIWLKSAKIARKSGLHQQAYMHILSATDSCPAQELYIEQAQLYWQKGCQEEAFTTLKRCFSNCFKPSAYYKQLASGECIEERRYCAKAKLLFAKYNNETANVDTDCSILNYKEVIEVWKEWDKSMLACADYYESIVKRMSDEERDTKGREFQIHMMNYYCKSLQFGCKYIHQSMPKLLTIWLDYASRTTTRTSFYGSEADKIKQDTLIKMTKIMEVYKDRLPTFMWLTAFSQLVSRICHPCRQVQETLCSILVKLICAYPQHCLWMMASVYNSSYPARQKRCQEIFNHSKLKTSQMVKLIRDFNRLWETMIELSNKPIADNTATTTVSALSKNLPKLLKSHDFSQIMLPTTVFRKLHLPGKESSIIKHQPFSMEWSYITGIEEKVAVMPSLQRPRRIAFKGSDGEKYLFMCKPKDDLRRDFRLMEFNDIVNKYLQKDTESRQRRLYIRTYSVVPLNEECGLIEWVPNLVGFRPILLSLYQERKIAVNNKELKTMVCLLKDPFEKKKKVFEEKLLPKHPPVLGDWFKITFPDPYGWYEARTAYIRTTAVMSMVGYILGLGDRHGENILFDSKCGDCVHVDFNCLFNRGELFDWPERVPFRLTHNMVDAMGPLRYEGPFRRACQITMRVLRQQSSTLLSVLTPFVYDPLVGWNKNPLSEAGEKTNEKAVEHIKNIEQRLKGLIRPQGQKWDNYGLNLSIEGQTNHLILEATNVDNLCQMYFGWGAYM